jgi:murein DD-endopeptidase MepM/ murein hydrolase activator NlpD
MTTLYGHASKLLVKEGDYVERGQRIALVGTTGVSTGNHLHFEVRIDGDTRDPMDYLPDFFG